MTLFRHRAEERRKLPTEKRTVIVILIMAMLITLVPTANVSAESIACLTEDPNADLYPFPLDMKVLSKYLYGSEENTKGKVYATYGRAIPKEWVPREMPQSLKNYGVQGSCRGSHPDSKSLFLSGWNRCWSGAYKYLWWTWNGAVWKLEAGSIFYPAQECLHN